MSTDDLFAILGFTAIATHATVSFRDTSWLPTWLGRGLTSSHPTVHLRVALCNLFYTILLLWLAWVRIEDISPLLTAMMSLAATYTFSQASVRAMLSFR